MSKAKIIASVAASATLAALPAAATFAATGDPVTSGTGEYTDTLQLTIDPTCTFTRKASGAHTSGDNYTREGQSTPGANGTWSEDLLSGYLKGNDVDNDFGSSHFHVVCNNFAGWKVTAETTALVGQTRGEEEIPVGTVAAGTAAWNYTPSVAASQTKVVAGSVNDGANFVAESGTDTTTGNDGVDFTVKYGVSTDSTLSAQVYQGTIKYTFAQL